MDRTLAHCLPLGCCLLLCLAHAAQAAEPVAPPGDWTLIGGGPYEQHYSPLHQVNDGNVGRLGLEWFADLDSVDGPTGVPLVSGGTVYESGPLGKVWAHDVRTGKLLWSYDPQIAFPTNLVASWGARLSRGLALWKDTVLRATGDCRLIALDRITGKLLWQVQTCDPQAYKTITGAPRVGDGKVFIGNSNADSGVGRGHVDAYDIQTGKHLWRFYTIPGDPSKGFESPELRAAAGTWGKDYWKSTGGGSPWEGITYDEVTHLVYVGTDGPAPFNPALRGKDRGDELYTNAIVALDADTGRYVWHYSTTPEDGWNYAATMPVILADLAIAGKQHHVVMSAPKNGFFYVLDALTGRLLNEPRPIIPINWASGIDMKTGRPIVRNEARYWLKGKEGAIVSPSPMGAHNWMPMSYNPATGLVYIPATDYPARVSVDPINSVGNVEIDFYYGLSHSLPFTGRLVAWDPVAQMARWTHDVGLPYEGGTLSTAGNLLFQGTTDGHFNAYKADTGERLLSYYAGSGILGAPSTVEIDGKQLILVPVGSGTTSAVGFAQRFSAHAPGPARLLAFSLDGRTALPPLSDKREPIPEPPAAEPEPGLALQGKAIWDANGCELCHGFQVVGGMGSVPDLRRIPAPHYEVFSLIVRGGLFKATGMPIFADSIRDEDLPALKAYLIGEAWKGYRADQAASSGH